MTFPRIRPAYFCAIVMVATSTAQAQAPGGPAPAKPEKVGFAEARTGDIPEGAAELITAETQKSIEAGLVLALQTTKRRWLVRLGCVSRQCGGDQPFSASHDGVGFQSRSRALRAADRPGLAVRHGQHEPIGLY